MNAPFRLRVDMLGTLVASCFALSACGGGDTPAVEGLEQPTGLEATSLDAVAPANSAGTRQLTRVAGIDIATGVLDLDGAKEGSIDGSAVDSIQTQGAGTQVTSAAPSPVSAVTTAAPANVAAPNSGATSLTFVTSDAAGSKTGASPQPRYRKRPAVEQIHARPNGQHRRPHHTRAFAPPRRHQPQARAPLAGPALVHQEVTHV